MKNKNKRRNEEIYGWRDYVRMDFGLGLRLGLGLGGRIKIALSR